MERKAKGVYALLSGPWFYSLFQRILGAAKFRSFFVDSVIRPNSTDRLLDIGCGPGDLLDSIPPVSYTGIDLNQSYIDDAKARYGERGQFLVGDVADLAKLLEKDTKFQIVILSGVIHHLDDPTVKELFKTINSILSEDGYLYTADPCFCPKQSAIALWLAEKDRGLHVRTPDQYKQLANSVFGQVDCQEHNDLLRIPYSHFIMRISSLHGEIF